MMAKKILIIEDDDVTRRILEAQMRAAGYDTLLASDGVTAIRVAQRERPDLVLLDLGLPGGDGFNVMERFRMLPRLSPIPIIVLSVWDPAQWKERALAAGAVAFHTKPLDPEALLSSVRSQLPAEGSEGTREQTGKKILIVEDDADTRLALSIRLKASGYSVALAGDSASAMTVALKEKPNLIILDLGLPAGDGFVLMTRLRRHPVLEQSPIIVLSALDPATNKERALREGAVAFFSKPADNEEFLAAIHRALIEPLEKS
jgi:DNA-binding response OmpR family regulator